MSAGLKIVKEKRALGIAFLVALFLSVMMLVTGPSPAQAASWQSWGGGLSSSPDSAWFISGVHNYLYVFVRGNDNQLWYQMGNGYNGSPFGDWAPLGGILTSGPAVAAGPNPGGPIDIFARGADGALWWRTFSPGWQSLGGIITSGPDAYQDSGEVVVCARGADNALWYRLYSGSWGPWNSVVGGNLTSDPTIAYDRDAGIWYIFARGTDNALWMWTAFTGWQSLGGTLASGPDASYDRESLVVAALGTDGAVWYRTHTGTTWSGWASLGGRGTSDPSVIGSEGVPFFGVTYAFVRGTDGQLWQTLVP